MGEKMTEHNKAATPLAYADNGRVVYAPLWWHKAGLQQTATGYGGKLTTPYKTLFRGRYYRVYVMCYGNGGTSYIIVKGKGLVLRNDQLPEHTEPVTGELAR